LSWATAWRIARRDLSARFRGLRLLLACLFLGVGALAAIGTLTSAISTELAIRGREILGGDIEVRVWQRALTPPEAAALTRLGTVSTGLRLQAMASANGISAPVALKAVDARWPMVGTLTLKDGRTVGAPPPGTVWLADGAAARLGVRPGDTVSIGDKPLTVGGVIEHEPELLGEGFNLGPVAITALNLPAQAGLTAPGAMYRTKARVLLRPGIDPAAAIARLKRQFPSSGFEYRTRDDAAPSTGDFVQRMGEFLVLVGLAALAIAGVGIGGGVNSYLDGRRGSIATLKVLGATSGDIARIYLLQIAAVAVMGSIAGIIAGVLAMPLAARALTGLLPVESGFVLAPAALARAAAYGLLVALVFAAPPLLRAREFPAMALMRARVAPLHLTLRTMLPPVGLGLAAILALALASATSVKMTAIFLAGTAGLFGLLALLGWVIRALSARLPRPRAPLLRAALANLHRPGTQTAQLVTALGFGLSAFVLLASVQTSLDANIARKVPRRAPDYFVLDLPREREAEFRAVVERTDPGAKVRTVPALRGAILAYGPANRTTRVADLKDIPDKAWALKGERGLTFAEDVPEGNTLVDGRWWPRHYQGPPLVSVDRDFADAVGLQLGDRITIGLLGVERSATVASLRRIDWDSFGFNNVLVFSPNALEDAPYSLAATIDLPPGAPSAGLLRQLVREFPSSSVVETGGLLRDARNLLGEVSTAILAAASVTVLAGLAVLLGAIAAARTARSYDNVILRVLGASRRQLLLLQIAEFGLLAAVLALVALALGSAIAWLVIVKLFGFAWLPDWPRVLGVLGAGLALVLAFAIGSSLPLLRARPAEVLREL
jgi:putative ABC transport system permease protein